MRLTAEGKFGQFFCSQYSNSTDFFFFWRVTVFKNPFINNSLLWKNKKKKKSESYKSDITAALSLFTQLLHPELRIYIFLKGTLFLFFSRLESIRLRETDDKPVSPTQGDGVFCFVLFFLFVKSNSNSRWVDEEWKLWKKKNSLFKSVSFHSFCFFLVREKKKNKITRLNSIFSFYWIWMKESHLTYRAPLDDPIVIAIK